MDIVRSAPVTALGEDTKKSIARRLTERGALHPKCEMCGNEAWIIGDYMVSPTVLVKDSPQSTTVPITETKFFPSIMIMCSNCGNSKLMNSMVLDVFDLVEPDLSDENAAA